MSEMEDVKITKEATTLFKKSGLKGELDFSTFLEVYKLFIKDNPTLRKSAVAFNGFLGNLMKNPHLEDKLYTRILRKRATDDDGIEELVKMMVSKEIREIEKRKEEAQELINPSLFSKRKTTEEENRKDRWEHGVKGLVGRQRRLVETGGLKDHIVGSKHQIPKLGAEEVRRIPKSIPTRPNSTQKYMEAEKESYARRLISQPDPIRAGQWNKAMTLGINTEAISEARRKLGKSR